MAHHARNIGASIASGSFITEGMTLRRLSTIDILHEFPAMSDRRHDPDAPPASARAPELGFAPMDSIHAEFDELLLRARTPGTSDWLQLLTDLDAHLRSHFEAENRWMLDTEFPPRDCHMDEHAAVLKSSQEVLALARQGDFDAAPSFIASLAEWFPGHADYLDSALAAWMCKRQFGGKPVVLHRPRGAGRMTSIDSAISAGAGSPR